MIFPLVITEQNRPLFKERGREGRKERGGVGGGAAWGEENVGHFSPRLWLFSSIFHMCDM